jgi:hypothetical protein
MALLVLAAGLSGLAIGLVAGVLGGMLLATGAASLDALEAREA